MEFIKNIEWDFLKFGKFAFILSGLMILAGIISLIYHGGPRYSIDFTGGRVLELDFGKEVNIGEVRNMLEQEYMKGIEVQSVSGHSWIIFRVPMALDEEYPDFSQFFLEKIRNKFTEDAGYKVTILSNEKVGPKVGEELRRKAIWAVLIALLAMLVYVWFRFQLRFGVASVIALFHDAFITLAVFSILDKEISLTIVAALLTIIGYSINDSIVISDRIRENMGKFRKLSFYDLVNKSLSQTFSRTIITSLVVLFVVLCLLFFGGPVIHDFALALFIGVIVGTYSSIYIVSPIVVSWEKWFPKKVR